MIRAALAVLALLAAAALAALAVDVLRLPGRIAADDAGFHGAPLRQKEAWEAIDFLPWSPAERLLDVGDDVAYRRTVLLYKRVEPGKVQIIGPELEALTGKVIVEVAQGSRREREPRRRAQLLNLHGMYTFARHLPATAFDKDRLLREAIGSFRSAVRLDPSNADARANLELALRAVKGSGLVGEDPDAGASRGKLSGIGRSGSGY